MSAAPHQGEASDPAGPPGVLDAQAMRVRAELAALSASLATVRDALDEDQISQLLAANEQLVRAALLADSIADKALLSLAGARPDDATAVAATAPPLSQLASAVAMARKRQTPLAVICVRVEASGESPGAPGGAAGDAVLQAAKRRLDSVLRHADVVSGGAGESVLLVLAEVARIGDTAVLAAKLASALAAPVPVDGHPWPLAASVGIAVYPLDGADPATLLALAEAAALRRGQAARGGGVGPAGAPGTAALAAAPVPDPAPPFLSPSHELRDVNERLIIAAVQAQQRQADAQDTARELQVRFLAMVAHELRNPLMPIRTAAEMLVRARDDEATLLRLQGVIKRQVTQMSRLVDDLLDTARITSGRFRLAPERIDLLGALLVARDACQPAIEARMQALSWRLPPGPIPIEADPVRLAQVFSNLLDNASKYTPRGGRLAVVVTLDDTAVAISVSDEGRGISATAMPRIFDLFAQDPRTLGSGGGGLGIGLAVVRELVEAHGGTIVAHSAGVDLGSEFVVAFPVSSRFDAA